MSFERVEDDDEAFHCEADDNPRGEETADISQINDDLTPAVFVYEVNPDPAEPDAESQAEQEEVVRGVQERQVYARGMNPQVAAKQNPKCHTIPDQPDDNNDRNSVYI